MMKRRTTRWAGHEASKTQNRNPTVLKRKNPKETDNLEEIDVNGRIMLNGVLRNSSVCELD